MADSQLAEPEVAPASNSPEQEPDTTEQALEPVKKTKKIIRRKKRPARVQADPSALTSEPPPQTGDTYNLWYNKWSGGDREDKYGLNTPAPGRCNVARDAGYTKADRVNGSFFCLHFARGVCTRGPECEYLHRLPTIHDLYPPNQDCFG